MYMVTIKELKKKFNIVDDTTNVYQVVPIDKRNVIIKHIGTVTKKLNSSTTIAEFEIDADKPTKIIAIILLEEDLKFLQEKHFYPIIKMKIQNSNISSVIYAFLPNNNKSFSINKSITGKFGIFVEKNKNIELVSTMEHEMEKNYSKLIEILIETYYNSLN